MNCLTTEHGTRVLALMKGRSAVYAVLTGKRFLVIDTSTLPNQKRLFRQVDSLLDEGHHLVGLALTHTHFDHVQNAAAFQECYKVPVLCHEEELDCIKQGRSPVVCGVHAPLRFATMAFKSIIEKWGRYEPCRDVTTFSESFDFAQWGIDAEFIHTPGHTLGSSSLVVAREVAIAGDTIFGVMPNRVLPPFAEDTNMLYDSWQRLLETDARILLPSHGSPRNRNELYEGLTRLQNRLKRSLT